MLIFKEEKKLPKVLEIVLVCPECLHVWHAASIVLGTWWAGPPEATAKQCYCPKCETPPPMRIHKIRHVDFQTGR
jgi:hypothetical protein